MMMMFMCISKARKKSGDFSVFENATKRERKKKARGRARALYVRHSDNFITAESNFASTQTLFFISSIQAITSTTTAQLLLLLPLLLPG
jgi:hypothetical protein